MSSDQVVVVSEHEKWAVGLDHPMPEMLRGCAESALPPGLEKVRIRLGIQRWPDGHEEHFNAELGDSLLEVMRQGAKRLSEELLPPHTAAPLDLFRNRHRDEWGEPITDLDLPLWLYLVRGASRRFGIEYRLEIRINTKWGVAQSTEMTPRQLLSSSGFEPNDFSLYRAESKDPLPPDTPIHLHRGEHFEAQKNGRYGGPAVIERGHQTIEDEIEAIRAADVDAQLIVQGGQRFVEIRGLAIPSPPWSRAEANIAIAVPGAYPQGGLDGFYLEQKVSLNGSIPNQGAAIALSGRTFVLISWHYAVGREWNPLRDELSSHLAHCRGFFLKRGVR